MNNLWDDPIGYEDYNQNIQKNLINKHLMEQEMNFIIDVETNTPLEREVLIIEGVGEFFQYVNP